MTRDSQKLETIRAWNENYYAKKGADRNNLLRRRDVVFQNLSFELSAIYALQAAQPDPLSWKILDVGCATGGSLLPFIKTGFAMENLHGVDISSDAIKEARRRFPAATFVEGGAEQIPYPSETFDIVTETTMLVYIFDEEAARLIASEMIRVTKTGRFLFLSDWVIGKIKGYEPLSKSRLTRLFSVGEKTDVYKIIKGPLLPPIGRSIGKYLPSIYFLVRAVFPFLVGAKTYVLKKN